MRIWPGEPYPLGATYDGEGTNFSVFSEVAEEVVLCLYDDDGRETCNPLSEVTGFRWHAYLPEVRPGQRYGFRVRGPWAPGQGHLCNPAKLLLDPYAKAVEGQVDWNEAVFPFSPGKPERGPNEQDSAPYVPKSVVIDPAFDWEGDRPPKRPLHESVIYEVHLKGFTARHPQVPPELRGTYAGFAHEAPLEYLKKLGVTAVELLPVHQFVHDARLLERGLRNYWGYNSISYLAPHNEYCSQGQRGEQVREFKQMIKALHRAGIEVILDVVYNHTAEGNHLGPMLCLKGFDNEAYYRLAEDEPRSYVDYTGTGNTLNVNHPSVLQLIMDSLRYWAIEMHVDGFRFDLAAALARELHEMNKLSAFLDLVQQDPVVSQVKLIAEPWDLGEGGYQVGNFPTLWSEWNGKYRDCVRDFWRGEDQTLAEFAYRFTGSSDLYENTGRSPYASINFVTAHDGFTLQDLVSYNDKHNEANGEENRDGESRNRSWNCGKEGPTDDPEVRALRARQKRNFVTTLLLSQGVPMLLGGDEIDRTQGGNNNAYCQDNEVSWFHWDALDEALFEYTRRLVRLRSVHPVFRRRGWFKGRAIRGAGVEDIRWFTPEGEEMEEENWREGFAKSLAVFLNGNAIACPNLRGEKIVDDTFCLLFNAYYETVTFTLPGPETGRRWTRLLDTADGSFPDGEEALAPGDRLHVGGRSLVILRQRE